MRLLSAYAVCVSAVINAAMLAGCSNIPQSTQALSGFPPPTLMATLSGGMPHYLRPNGRVGPISALRLIRLQAEGKLPAPATPEVMALVLKQAAARPQTRAIIHGNTASVVIWAVNSNAGYLAGQKKNGRKTISSIDAQAYGCLYPQGLKIDHSQNIWDACEYNGDLENGVVQQFNSAGTFQNNYNVGCPQPTSECAYWYSYAYDVATDGAHVFAAIPYSEEEICTSGCAYSYGSGVEWWPANSPSSNPSYINLGQSCEPVCTVYFMDTDSSGNIWIDYFGSNGSGNGYGLGEITNPTTDPQFVSIVAPGTFECGGGIYVSTKNGAQAVNVSDECRRTISQYALPFVASESPTILGPTKENFLGQGSPLSGGFNKDDTKFVVGDSYGWIDMGKVADNFWKRRPSVNFGGYVPAAAYTPSDK
ncbi:MAG: hypothetical protein ABSD52_07840 [Candidatus Cybelea sp.]